MTLDEDTHHEEEQPTDVPIFRLLQLSIEAQMTGGVGSESPTHEKKWVLL